MQAQPVFHMPAPTETADAYQAAQLLGKHLTETPEYQAFLQTLMQVNDDLTVEKISAQMRACQSALQWDRDVDQNAAELQRLELEMENLPLIQAYRQAEKAAVQLFRAVDEMISHAAGIPPFAPNAKRSGCSCGG